MLRGVTQRQYAAFLVVFNTTISILRSVCLFISMAIWLMLRVFVFRALRLNFFFQAEDGIRDTSVTGVQTCALPISLRPRRGSRRAVAGCRSRERRPAPAAGFVGRRDGVRPIGQRPCGGRPRPGRRGRSEERRVGEEGGGRGPRCGGSRSVR